MQLEASNKAQKTNGSSDVQDVVIACCSRALEPPLQQAIAFFAEVVVSGETECNDPRNLNDDEGDGCLHAEEEKCM
jgi:hypothetical protein